MIASLAARERLASTGSKALAEAGGLIGYGVNAFPFIAARPILWIVSSKEHAQLICR